MSCNEIQLKDKWNPMRSFHICSLLLLRLKKRMYSASYMKFEVFITVKFLMLIFRNVGGINRRFREPCCLHFRAFYLEGTYGRSLRNVG